MEIDAKSIFSVIMFNTPIYIYDLCGSVDPSFNITCKR